MQDFQNVFGRQRLKIEAVGRVIVSRHRFRVAVDHDGFIADLFQREAGVAAAIIELDPLPDAVRATTENDDLLAVRWLRFAGRHPKGRGLIGRVHIRRLRLKLGRARVDPLENGADAKTVTQFAHFLLGHAAGHGAHCIVNQARAVRDGAFHARLEVR